MSRRPCHAVHVRGAYALVSLVACLTAACSDSTDRVVAPVQSDSSAIDSAIARAVLDRNNPFAWVGTAHNEAMRVTYEAMLAKRLPGRNPCAEILVDEFVALAPPQHRQTTPDIAGAAAAGRSATRCADPTTARALNVSDQLGPAAAGIVSAVEAALDGMTSPGELAVNLVPLAGSASALTEPERSVVLSAISVAHNSADYWFANWTTFSKAVIDQYGACVASGASFDTCSGGLARRPMGLGSARATMECDIGFLRMVQGLGKADLVGALAGGLRSVLTGPAGVGMGALVGGAVGSVAWGLNGAIDQSICTLAR